MTRIPITLCIFAALSSAELTAASSIRGDGLADTVLEQVRAECEKRCDALFHKQAGQPLIRNPIKKDWMNRGDFTRHYNQSIVLFAARTLYLSEQVGEANAALREMCEYHLARPQTLLETHILLKGVSPGYW